LRATRGRGDNFPAKKQKKKSKPGEITPAPANKLPKTPTGAGGGAQARGPHFGNFPTRKKQNQTKKKGGLVGKTGPGPTNFFSFQGVIWEKQNKKKSHHNLDGKTGGRDTGSSPINEVPHFFKKAPLRRKRGGHVPLGERVYPAGPAIGGAELLYPAQFSNPRPFRQYTGGGNGGGTGRAPRGGSRGKGGNKKLVGLGRFLPGGGVFHHPPTVGGGVF